MSAGTTGPLSEVVEGAMKDLGRVLDGRVEKRSSREESIRKESF